MFRSLIKLSCNVIVYGLSEVAFLHNKN